MLRASLRAAVTVALCAGLARLLALGRDVALANLFGTGDTVELFWTAYGWPTLLANMVGASVAAILVARQATWPEATRERWAAAVTGAATWGLLLLGGLGALLAEPLSSLLAPGFAADKRAMLADLLRLTAPLGALQGLALIWGARLNAAGRFAWPAAAPALTPLAMLTLLALWGVAGDARTLVWGALLGAGLEVASLARLAWRRGLSLGLDPSGACQQLAEVARGAGPLMLGSVAQGLMAIVDVAMASALAAGDVARLTFGTRLVALANTLAAVPLAAAVLPALATLAAGGGGPALRRYVWQWAGLILAVTLPATALAAALSPWLVDLLFGHGQLGPADAARVAEIQALALLQLPPYLLGLLGVRLLTVEGRTGTILAIASFNLLAKLGLNAALIPSLGVAGIALATSLVYLLSATWIILALAPTLRPKPKA